MFVKKILINVYNNLYEKFYLLKDICLPHRKINIMTCEETIQNIIKNRSSVSRYGDADFFIMSKDKTGYQEFDEELSKKLCDTLNARDSNCLTCLPDFFNDLSRYTKTSQKVLRKILAINRKKWYKYIDFNLQYGNSMFSRPYTGVKNNENSGELFKSIQQLWDKKNILILEGDLTRMGVGNDLFANAQSIKRILCPNKNAFRAYQDTIEEVKKYTGKFELILLALGPTATVLAYDLSKLGFWAVDIGHLDIQYECYLKKSRNQKVVTNKFVNECQGGDQVSEVHDTQYRQEIIAVMGEAKHDL